MNGIQKYHEREVMIRWMMSKRQQKNVLPVQRRIL